MGSILMPKDNTGKIMNAGEAKAIFSPAERADFIGTAAKNFAAVPLYTGLPR